MRQYTTQAQTAKLIELGFPKPKFEIETQMYNAKGQPLRVATIVGDYSIGELIEMLMKVNGVKISFESMYGGRRLLIIKMTEITFKTFFTRK